MLPYKLQTGPYNHFPRRPELQQKSINQQVVLTSFLHTLPHTSLLLLDISRKTQTSVSISPNSNQELTSQCQSVQSYFEADPKASTGETLGLVLVEHLSEV